MRDAQVIHGDCIEVMRRMPDSSVDAIVTDPPYGLGFMGKHWDDLPPGLEWAKECLRVLKPGGHLLAFGGTRTWHRLAVAVEDAGFEIRDNLAWLYGAGMPKGRATLKPSFEPVVVARKPYRGSLLTNEALYGTGALGIDSCRIKTTDKLGGGAQSGAVSHTEGWDRPWKNDTDALAAHAARVSANVEKAEMLGRWPANVLLDEQQAERLDEISGASRFFYVAKAPKKERPVVDGVAHPTVKPLSLMRYLVKLVTPPGGTVLEPFAGSGATVEACLLEGFDVIAIEREAEYLPLIQARIDRQSDTLDFGVAG